MQKKYLEYSVGDGMTTGDNWELLAEKIAPLDFLSLGKAIKVIEKKGGIQKIISSMQKGS